MNPKQKGVMTYKEGHLIKGVFRLMSLFGKDHASFKSSKMMLKCQIPMADYFTSKVNYNSYVTDGPTDRKLYGVDFKDLWSIE